MEPGNKVVIRDASIEDLPILTQIYNYYVVNTSVTFDTSAFTPAMRQSWFDQFAPAGKHQLLVAEEAGVVRGYASSLPLRPKPAYSTSVETTIYLEPDAGGRGIGKSLYSGLLARLSKTDVHRCYGIVVLPNAASMALHHALGYVQVAHLSEVGFKFDQYWDTVWLEKTV